MLWDLNEGKHLYTLEGHGIINALTFSPNRYWLCAAAGPVIKIWDLEDKRVVDELKLDVVSTSSSKAKAPAEVCLLFSSSPLVPTAAHDWTGDVPGVVGGRADALRGLHGQPHPRLAGLHRQQPAPLGLRRRQLNPLFPLILLPLGVASGKGSCCWRTAGCYTRPS